MFICLPKVFTDGDYYYQLLFFVHCLVFFIIIMITMITIFVIICVDIIVIQGKDDTKLNKDNEWVIPVSAEGWTVFVRLSNGFIYWRGGAMCFLTVKLQYLSTLFKPPHKLNL